MHYYVSNNAVTLTTFCFEKSNFCFKMILRFNKLYKSLYETLISDKNVVSAYIQRYYNWIGTDNN